MKPCKIDSIQAKDLVAVVMSMLFPRYVDTSISLDPPASSNVVTLERENRGIANRRTTVQVAIISVVRHQAERASALLLLVLRCLLWLVNKLKMKVQRFSLLPHFR